MQTTRIGDKGELLAADVLAVQGYEIIARNWKVSAAEVDIVALKNEIIYFVEVKYRETDNQGDGFDYITGKKLYHMERAAEIWTVQNNWSGEYMLLAASVSGLSGKVDIREIV